MPTAITAYRVLLEVPDDLLDERRAFGKAIHAFNERDAVPRGVLFVPLGWEPGVALARREVDEELQGIDYFVLVLEDRWRSGVEEEVELALDCLRSDDQPMSKIIVFFTAVSPRQLSDPGEQLRKILAFQERLQEEREVTVETFDSAEAFQTRMRWHLNRWLMGRERRQLTPVSPVERAPSAEDAKTSDEWTDHPMGEDPDSYNEYGCFLQRDGDVDGALELHKRALILAREQDKPIIMAVAYGNLGVIHGRRHEYEKAEEMLQRSLKICEAQSRSTGAAACYHSLGTIFRSQDRLEEAEQMFRAALESELSLDRAEGIVACYASLALIYDYRRERAKANEMRKLAQAMGQEPEYPRGELFPRRI